MEKKTYTRKSADGKAPRRSTSRETAKAVGRAFGKTSGRSAGRDGEKPARRAFAKAEGEERPARRTYRRAEGEERPARRTYRRAESEERPARRTFVKDAPKAVKKVAPKSDEVRLNKFIANSGICSRREADTYIQTGLVKVNGKIVTELGTKVNPEKDDIRFNNEPIHGEKKVYIVMNKPKDYVTTLSDPHAEHTVMELISPSKCPERIVPVGRLDKATTGVLMFTNDGDLTEKLTHPSHQVKKIYHATLDKNLTREDFNKILEGIVLEDGPIAADSLSYVGDDKSQVGLEIHSGRNRIVRRIFESLGYRVKKLDRVYFAGLTKKNIRRGQWRFLTEKEVNILKMGSFE